MRRTSLSRLKDKDFFNTLAWTRWWGSSLSPRWLGKLREEPRPCAALPNLSWDWQLLSCSTNLGGRKSEPVLNPDCFSSLTLQEVELALAVPARQRHVYCHLCHSSDDFEQGGSIKSGHTCVLSRHGLYCTGVHCTVLCTLYSMYIHDFPCSFITF